VAGPNLFHHFAELDGRRLVDDIWIVHTNHGLVRGDDQHIEIVDLRELLRLGLCSTRHPCQPSIHAEIVLEGDGGQSQAFSLYTDVFLGFDRLVQPFRIPAAVHEPAGELVYDDHIAIGHHVIAVTLKERLGLESVL